VRTGNICRSPTAHAVARHKAKELGLDGDFILIQLAQIVTISMNLLILEP